MKNYKLHNQNNGVVIPDNTGKYKWKIVANADIYQKANIAYCAMHGTSPEINIGDITQSNIQFTTNANVVVGGTPCVDFSYANMYQKGCQYTCNSCKNEYSPLDIPHDERRKCPQCGSEDIDRTSSSLLINYLDIVAQIKPEFLMYENVKAIKSKRFGKCYELFLKELESYGYNIYENTINAKDYVPQHRERVIVIGIRKNIDNGKFKFPLPPKNRKVPNELLENYSKLFEGNNKKIIVDQKISPYVRKNIETNIENIINSDKNIYHVPCKSGFVDNQVGINYVGALRASNPNCIVLNTYDMPDGKRYYIKRLTPKEAFRFMGFDDSDYEKVKAAGLSDSAIYKIAGNSIVVDVIYAVIKELFRAMPYLFKDIKLIHLCSGCGAFETAFERLYKSIQMD